MRTDHDARTPNTLLILATILLTLSTAGITTATLAPGGCVDFESLTTGTIYNVTDSFADSGVTVTAAPFQWSNGTWTSAGFSEVETNNLGGGTGRDLEVNNITLEFDFGRDIDSLRLLFGEYGGNINLTINGDFRNESNFSVLHGQIVGGTLVEVLTSPPGFGVIRITGVVNSFSIGGQELWIDDVCDAEAALDCIEFEDQPYPQSFSYGQFFVASGVIIELGEFDWFPSGSTTGGSCNIDTNQTAGGTGKDVNSNNINLDFDFDCMYGRLDLLYTDLGGNTNLSVNGASANVNDITNLHMTSLGGALIEVYPATGHLIVSGPIADFSIGGQELWIDHVCIFDRSLFVDDFEFGHTAAWSTVFP